MKTEVILSPNNFGPEQQEEMWNIYSKFYNYSKDYFIERMTKISDFALYKSGEKLIGFTGLKINKIRQGRNNNLMIYFGQTVIDKKYRGKSLLPLTGSALIKKYWKSLLFGKMYFWCDALTYKPYLVFAKTLDQFYPSRNEVMPKKLIELRNHLGKLNYGESFCPISGIVKKDQRYVDDPSVVISEFDLRDPDIQFYAQSNPGHLYGNGLLTIAPLSFTNFIQLSQRAIRKLVGLNPSKKPRTSKLSTQNIHSRESVRA